VRKISHGCAQAYLRQQCPISSYTFFCQGRKKFIFSMRATQNAEARESFIPLTSIVVNLGFALRRIRAKRAKARMQAKQANPTANHFSHASSL